MAKHIFSTLSADTKYADWVTQAGVGTVRRSVLVRGGAGVALRGAGQTTVTPAGIRTEVSDEDAAFLASFPPFKEHMERGFVRIENIARDPDAVAKKMESDASGPKTPADVKQAAADAAAKTGLSPDESLAVMTNKKK